MSLDSIRPYVTKVLIDPVSRKLTVLGISPNTLSIISLLFAALAGLLYYISGRFISHEYSYLFLFLAGVSVLINSGLDALDGSLARQKGIESKLGDFLDHVIDRYSDVFILCGILLGGFCNFFIGIVTLSGVLLTSYLGTQAQAIGIGRYYGGLMGRVDRLVLILFATLAELLFLAFVKSPFDFYGFSFLGWCMIFIGIGSHITAFQRIYHIWSALKNE
ncbi:MAG: CDP-alcohol phosphatidyltransferase family protein [Methanosarcinaceae archaeon]|nr:CDP-alcohol phosphatidyltransferase family protein [Methanosarcinaceae archaeon]